MSAGRFFCSDASRANGEQIYGTVAHIDSWLLIEYPGAWRPYAISDSALPDGVKQQLRGMARHSPGQRQLFIRQGYQRRATLRCFIAESREADSRLAYFDFADYDEIGRFDAASAVLRATDETILLVCTHGTHDKCCAKFGRPVYASLHNCAPERTWECTHVGGDRFAGNVVCLPHGIYYGHVEPDEATILIDTLARREIWLEKYRGRCCYPRVAQVGEYFVRHEMGIKRIDALRLLGIERTPASGWRVRFEAAEPGQTCEAEFRTASRHLYQPLTCKSGATGSIRQYELVRCRCRPNAGVGLETG
ncbi:MAG TPA: sucrase ferredoxin [Bryobacteraceae bacterium]|nr:sucrase ferredoxin [Bryobacteraceae bacterium]